MNRLRPWRRSTRGLFLLLASLPAAVLVLGLLYMAGTRYLEGDPRDLLDSLEWAAETLTTTGYGADARWHHPLMVALVILAQFSGLFLVFLIFPIYVLPYFEERFEARLPNVLPRERGYVLIYHYGATVSTLIEELQRFGRTALVMEETRAAAREVQDRGLAVVLTRPGAPDFDTEGLGCAAAIVANGEDHENAALVLMAREHGYAGPIYAFAEHPRHRLPIRRAGADAVYTPRHALAAALAGKASEWINPRISGVQQLGEHVVLAELRIHGASPLAGRTLGSARIRETHGTTVIGLWSGGRFEVRLSRDTRLETGTVLVVIGARAAVERLGAMAQPLKRSGPFVICGFGEVGTRIREILADAGEPTLVINDQPGDGVDVAGNVLDESTLVAARVREARAVILAIGNDSETLFAAAVVRDYAPHVPLIARVNEPRAVERVHRVGVDFALSVGDVAGQLVARNLIGEEYVSVEPNLRVMKVAADAQLGSHPWRTGMRDATGCQVVAVGRAEEVWVEFDEAFRIEPGDTLYVCGSPEAFEEYFRRFPAARPTVPEG